MGLPEVSIVGMQRFYDAAARYTWSRGNPHPDYATAVGIAATAIGRIDCASGCHTRFDSLTRFRRLPWRGANDWEFINPIDQSTNPPIDAIGLGVGCGMI